jgi:hypothetical protein
MVVVVGGGWAVGCGWLCLVVGGWWWWWGWRWEGGRRISTRWFGLYVTVEKMKIYSYIHVGNNITDRMVPKGWTISMSLYSIFYLTLTICVKYLYSAASHASCPDGVPVLQDFHVVVK